MAEEAEDLVDRAARELYAADPESFVPRRAELVRDAKRDGAKDAAKAIAALRKPTKAASILNRFAAAEPDLVVQLLQVGGELRRAERALDGPQLRELSTKRRTLVSALVREAVQVSGQQATAAVQDELTGTLNAAIANDAVAEQLQQGMLTQSSEWEGFGSGGAATLSLVPNLPQRPAVPPRSTGGAHPSDTGRPSPGGNRAADRTADRTADRAADRAEKTSRAAALKAEADNARARAEATRKRLRDEADRAEQDLAEADAAAAAAAAAVASEQQLLEELSADLERAQQRLKEAQAESRQAQTGQRMARLTAERARRRLQPQ